MANSKQAKKRAIQADKRRDHNASLRSTVRTYIKKVVLAIQSGDKAAAQAAYAAAVAVFWDDVGRAPGAPASAGRRGIPLGVAAASSSAAAASLCLVCSR